MPRVVLLGAGFSRALSPDMPLLIDLAGPVTELLHGEGREDLARFGGNVEEYLTFIGTDQPWLSEEENLRNRALFGDTVSALQAAIEAAQTAAERGELASWLERVAWQWSYDRSAVLTFNYDTLLDKALMTAGGIGAEADLYGAPLTSREPAGSGPWLAADAPRKPFATLYKLHGSINWLHGGDAAPTTDPLILDGRGRRGGIAAPRYDRVYEGLQAFLIPPTSIKNRYYDRAAVRAQWAAAARQLQAADQLTVIGYSLPSSDSGTNAFLRSNLNAEAEVRVVDRSEAVAPRFGKLLDRRVSAFPSVDDWLDTHVADTIDWWVSDEQPESVTSHLFINGVDSSDSVPRSLSAEHFETWRRENYPDLVDIERNLPREFGTFSRGRRLASARI